MNNWPLLAAVLVLAALFTGCSGQSGGLPPFAYPIPTDLTLSGAIDIGDVAIHPDLGGVVPVDGGASRRSVRGAMLDLSVFRITVEDDPAYAATPGRTGAFGIASITLRDQIVLRARNSEHSGFVLEWMAADPTVLIGMKQARITIYSTARSFIARTLRDRFGRRIDPEQITDGEIRSTILALTDVLERHPEKIAGGTRLDQVAEVRAAVDAAADALDAAQRGYFGREWTILVYQGGDNSLSDVLEADIEEMKRAGPPAGTAVIIQNEDRALGTRRMLLKAGSTLELGRKSDENAADPSVLADFISWGHRAFPARRMALIVASHGTGWRPASVRSALISDDTSAAMMDIPILKTAIGYGITVPGGVRPLALLGFDACLMGMLEVAAELQGMTKVLVFSQANEPAPGWDYERLFKALSASSAQADGIVLGKTVANAYKSAYESGPLEGLYSGTLSVIDMEKLPGLITRFSAWAAAIRSDLPLNLAALKGARDALENTPDERTGSERYLVQAFEHTDQRDLRDLVANLRSSFPNANIPADNLTYYINTAVPVPLAVRFGTRYRRANGLSIALPADGEYAGYLGPNGKLPYAGLALSQATEWDELIAAMNASGYTSAVDGRNLFVKLSWSGSADLDLYVGEPDPAAPADPLRMIWHTPSAGAETPNGRFGPDSVPSGLREEVWSAAGKILPGVYHIAAYTRSGAATVPAFRIATIATSTTILGDPTPAGGRFPAARVTVTTSDITIEPILPEPPEEE
ncbi:MAG TPA: clostripain-related cysteine peptidase [Candidatus Ozemobacteraceae bacterium]|nr:clostripain-related cysteine peptidase [Candidatus Ozemobacteraceae bacterium]